MKSTSFPVGSITPVVLAQDMINGVSDLVKGAPVKICASACSDTDVDITGKMSEKLDAQVDSLKGSANKNKMANVLNAVAGSINSAPATTAAQKEEATKMRTKMADNLLAAVGATDGPPLDVNTAASALASIAGDGGQLSAETQA